MLALLLKENWIAFWVCLSDTDSGSFSLRLLAHWCSLQAKTAQRWKMLMCVNNVCERRLLFFPLLELIIVIVVVVFSSYCTKLRIHLPNFFCCCCGCCCCESSLLLAVFQLFVPLMIYNDIASEWNMLKFISFQANNRELHTTYATLVTTRLAQRSPFLLAHIFFQSFSYSTAKTLFYYSLINQILKNNGSVCWAAIHGAQKLKMKI